jgi:hypothetical protein
MRNFLLEDYGRAERHSYMHLHAIVKIDAAAFIALQYPSQIWTGDET